MCGWGSSSSLNWPGMIGPARRPKSKPCASGSWPTPLSKSIGSSYWNDFAIVIARSADATKQSHGTQSRLPRFLWSLAMTENVMSNPTIRVGVLVFPGSNCDRDCHEAVTEVLGARADFIWHKDPTLPPLDAVIIPGGFSYGDYLRTGAIARFSPVMAAVTRFAESGGLVLGICNGFQI